MKTITILAIPSAVASSIANLIDTFTLVNLEHRARAGRGEPLFEVKVVADGREPVDCNSFVKITPDLGFDDDVHSDYLIIPGLLPVPKSSQLRQFAATQYICRAHSSGTTVASVCTGSFLLAETGLLDGRLATTNWLYGKKFSYRYPKVKLDINKLLTEDGNIICSGAVTAIMHLALHIIRRECSSSLASACAKMMLVDPNLDSQAPYIAENQSVAHGDSEIQRAETYLRTHMQSIDSIDQVAELVCISPRHFKRRFKAATGETPLNYLQKLRVQEARYRLENSRETIEEITRRVGYENSCTFRRLFKRYTSLSPREYRDRFMLSSNHSSSEKV